MLRVSGWLYEDGRFRRGSATVEDGVITGITHQRAKEAIATGLILPAFTNAHTHAGDAVVRADLTGTLEELVAPPHGLKHRVLARAKDEDVVSATREYLESMSQSGTARFWDFREMGVRGVRQLYGALLGLPLRPLVFGRPTGLEYEGTEVRSLLRACDGIGISSRLDWKANDAAKLARDAHAAGKLFATHASERIREDIDGVLDLKPDLLVHLTEATDADLERVADAEVPVAVCPRSNAFFGKLIDLPRMVRAGVRILLGTDNAMINTPSMFRELDFAWKVARLKGGIEPHVLLDAALGGRGGLGEAGEIALAPGDPGDLIVVDVPRGEPTFSGVFQSGEGDIALVSLAGRTWVRKHAGLAEIRLPVLPRRRGVVGARKRRSRAGRIRK